MRVADGTVTTGGIDVPVGCGEAVVVAASVGELSAAIFVASSAFWACSAPMVAYAATSGVGVPRTVISSVPQAGMKSNRTHKLVRINPFIDTSLWLT